MQRFGVSKGEMYRFLGNLVIFIHLWAEDYCDEIFREQPGRITKTLGLHGAWLSSIFKEIDSLP